MDPQNNKSSDSQTTEPVSVFDQSQNSIEREIQLQQIPQEQSSQPESPINQNPQQPISSQPPATPPTPPQKPNPFRMLSKIPLKAVLIGLLALVILSAAGIAAKTFFSKPKAPEQITLTYWGMWEDTDTIKELISEYQSQNPNVTINYVKQINEDYQERLSNALKNGRGPDIFRFHNTWLPMLSSQMSSLPSSVMDQQTFKSTFYPVMAKDLARGNDFVGMPLMYDGLALYINEDLFSKAQANAPATWDDVRQTAQNLTVKDAEGRIQQAGVALGRTDNVDNWQDILSLLMIQNGVDMKNPTGPLAEGALNFYTNFAKEKGVWDASMPQSTQAFAGGKVAMYFGPSWKAFEIKQLNPNLNFRVVPMPQLPKNSSSDPDINWASYWVEGVSAKSTHQVESWKFLKYLSEKTSQQRLYANTSKSRLFGPIYSRVDMADSIMSDPFIGAYVKEAPTAQSWYMAGRTFDGTSGINTKLSDVFSQAIDKIFYEHKDVKEVMPQIAQGIQDVLSRYR